MKIINSKRIFLVALIGVYVVFFLLNYLTPLIADDFAYIYKTGSFTSILYDEYLQYLHQNGRSIAHIMARFFLLMPKMIFNLINPIIFLGIVYFIYKISNQNRIKYNSVRFFLIVISIFLFVPKFGETLLWETGSFNYLWTFLIMISFLYVYHKKTIYNETTKIPILAMFVFGIFAGWCNENTSAGTLLLIVGYVVIEAKVNNKSISGWMISGLLGEILGFIIMMNSPGNKIRSGWFARSSWSLLKKFFYGLADVSNALTKNASILIILTVISIVFCVFLYRTKYNYILGVMYLLVGGATCYSLSISPAGFNWGRSYFGGIMFIIIAFIICFPDFREKNSSIINPFFSTILLTLTIYAFFNFTNGLVDIYESYGQINQRYSFIVSEKKKGNNHPEVSDFDFYPKTEYPAYSPALSHINSDENYKYNKYTASYFGVKTVKTLPSKEWSEKYKN
ncbi:DUF6056 family protein [Enterococcus avium]|uniref:DUF3329 domain-containing protein n=1 Tax=Enterococcus TaxID=1350 RepID=UPI0008A4B2C4|nr:MULTISPECIES: DUF6056 family protein [Enterococcus]MCB6527968.1 DUF6056 family protein [Enterococcus avium]MCG4865624.1 DUF6056 family protein [Enterococcus avium]MCQ4673663.1 DUF6056 family protein [Enterococcus avium]MDT2493554.1 DUF6056 family protein [Enterococcus avium]OFL84989.1 hypothetical protein HMPREF2742_19135 [Enterococcus sp. HMSC072H05]